MSLSDPPGGSANPAAQVNPPISPSPPASPNKGTPLHSFANILPPSGLADPATPAQGPSLDHALESQLTRIKDLLSRISPAPNNAHAHAHAHDATPSLRDRISRPVLASRIGSPAA